MELSKFIKETLSELEKELRDGLIEFDLPVTPVENRIIMIPVGDTEGLSRIKFTVKIAHKESE